MFRYVVLLIFFLKFASHPVFSTEKFTTYIGIEHGLSNNNVTKIFQDKQGFMWFGTYDGLNRYNGYDFITYKHQPGRDRSLPDNRITDIIEDHNGILWVATKVGLAAIEENTLYFKRAFLKHSQHDRESIEFAINQLALGKNNTIFAGSEQAGLLVIEGGSKENIVATSIALKDQNTTNERYNVQALVVDKNERLWLFVHNYGLCYYDVEANIVKVKDKHILYAAHMTSSADGDLWIATNHGVYRYDTSHNRYKHYNFLNGLSSNNVMGIYCNKNKVWVYTDGGGITVIDIISDKKEYISDKSQTNAIKSQTVNAVYEDASSRVWIGTLRGGINIIDPQRSRFQQVKYNDKSYNGNPKNYILSFAEGPDDNIWIGTDGGGLLLWDKRNDRFKSSTFHEKVNNEFVTSIVHSKNGDLWVGTYGGGINRLDPTHQNIKTYKCIGPNGYGSPNVWKILEDSQGRIWVSTLDGGGLYTYDEKSDSFVQTKMKIYDALTIYEENADILWFGSWSTLTKLNLKNGQSQVFQIGSPVRSIAQENNNQLWIATEGGGLLDFDINTGKFKRFTELEGLPSNTVLNILQDNENNLWLSTYHGLSKFNTKENSFQNYDESDGLQSNQFSYNAALKLTSGEMLFGGIRGFNIFNPDSLKQNISIPPLLLTSFYINGLPYDQHIKEQIGLADLSSIAIKYDEANFSFSFVALEYSYADKIRYAYYLEGWDKDWNYVDKQRTAIYSGLREGRYTLRIRSTNADGVWNMEERTISVEVYPPWWRTGWAYASYLVSILVLLYIYIRYDRNQTKLKYQVQLADIKSKQEKELHEKKISFFTHIAHEFRNPLTLIVNPIKEMLHSNSGTIDKPELSPIYNNAKRLLILVDKLLLFRSAENGFEELRLVKLDIVNLTKEVFQCFKQHAARQSIDYNFHCQLTTCEILADREKLEICLFNLISNAIKYTSEHGSVTIHLEQIEKQVLIHIKDTGSGIPSHSGERIFQMFQRDYGTNPQHKEGFGIGLFLVKKFAEAHKGTVSYRDNRPRGTCFTLTLTTDETYFKNQLVFEDINEHSVFMEEIISEINKDEPSPQSTVLSRQSMQENVMENISSVVTNKKNLLIVDDNRDIQKYLEKIFENNFIITLASSAEEALECIEKQEPDIIISDVVMDNMSGIDLCTTIKSASHLNHIPIILLTASSSQEIKLKGLEGGADDYITKPFDKDLLIVRVNNLIQSRNRLQNYFYNEITLQKNDYKISSEYKDFIEKAISIVERQLDNPEFTVKTLADHLGMSHSNMYKRIKSISGKSANEFIRFVRLRNVAKQLISTDNNINEAAFSAGFNDIKYFRMQFLKLFGMNPSEYKKKYKTLKQKHQLKL